MNRELFTNAMRATEIPLAEAPGYRVGNIQGYFYENEPYRSRQTRVFAWIGLPDVSPGTTVPAMVLLHGGGGTAFAEWVKRWNDRGYAAIAMDLCGCVPEHPEVKDGEAHERHGSGGPPGWDASFIHIDEPVQDQWQYHAVSAAMRAHTILARMPEVDANRIGLTGISWGGYLTCLVAGIDPRFKLAIPVYGCGYLGVNSIWNDTVFPSLQQSDVKKWLEYWDPSSYLPLAAMPFCWVSGTNDFAYPLDSLKASYLSPIGDPTLCIRVDMPHSHTDGWAPAEIGVFADSLLKNGLPLPRILSVAVKDGKMCADFSSDLGIDSAEIAYTRAHGTWQDRKFNILPAVIDHKNGHIEAEIPINTTVCFLILTDIHGHIVSTMHIETDQS